MCIIAQITQNHIVLNQASFIHYLLAGGDGATNVCTYNFFLSCDHEAGYNACIINFIIIVPTTRIIE